MAAQPLIERVRLPSGRPLVWEDLQAIPDEDYWGIELVEGRLIVSPSWDTRHQSCVLSLAALLRATCPPDLKVFVAPYDYVPRPGYSLQPDVLVARRADLGPKRLDHAPVLVVEVLSPSSRLIDRTLKRAVYEEQGVAHYWLVDPDEPGITALGLIGDEYTEAAHVSGSQRFDVQDPFRISVVPVELLDE